MKTQSDPSVFQNVDAAVNSHHDEPPKHPVNGDHIQLHPLESTRKAPGGWGATGC